MIYIKCFELGDKCVMLVPRRYGKFAIKIVGYKSQHYDGWTTQNFNGFKYIAFTGSLSECNDLFNQEVSYLCRCYDDLIYEIAERMSKKEEVLF